MKIALVTNNYKPYGGGVVSAIEVIAAQFVSFGHQVYIITLDFEGRGDGFEGEIAIIRVFCPIRFIYQTKHIAIPWWPSHAVLQILAKIKPDIIHSQHPFLLGVAAIKAGQKLGIPVVFTYHSQYEKFAHLVPLPEILCTSLIRHKIINYCNQVDGIVAPSSFVAQFLQSQGCAVQTKIIPSGVAPFYLESRSVYKKIKKRFELLTVSRFAKEKDLPLLLKMFSKLVRLNPNFNLTLAGYGPEKENLVHYAYQVLNLSEAQVLFVERPSKNQIKQLYWDCDLFIFASMAETQGLVLAEAMACGTPVVALAGPGQNDLIINGKNGFLVKNLDEMVDVIQLIACDLKLHQNMQKAALEAGKSYDPNLLARRLIDFYQQII